MKCAVCKVEMGWNPPSGVCSVECLNAAQGFTKEQQRPVRVMNVFKVTFEDGDWLTTGFNGTLEDAKAYYIDQTFNLGTETDKLLKAVKVEQVNK